MTAGVVSELGRKAAPISRAIVEAVIAEQLGRDDLDGIEYVAETVDVMNSKIANMSRFMATAMLSATLVLGASAAPRGGAFQSLPLAARQAHLQTWRQSPISFFRDFIMFWEKMTTFVFYCHREEAVGHHVDGHK